MLDSKQIDIAKGERGQAKIRLQRMRHLSMEERARMLKAVCSAAAKLHASRRQAGLPPAVPAPWPESTWEFMRRNAPNARRD
jgi:hypothetical protein